MLLNTGKPPILVRADKLPIILNTGKEPIATRDFEIKDSATFRRLTPYCQN